MSINQKLADHERRFDGWPTHRQAVRAQMPEHDGDMSELDELQERIFDALADLPWSATASCVVDGDGDVIYQSMHTWFGIA